MDIRILNELEKEKLQGVPLDKLQEGDFNYNTPVIAFTLSDFARILRGELE
jgi:hypothetical protein